MIPQTQKPLRKVRASLDVHYTTFSESYPVWWFENGQIQPDDGHSYEQNDMGVYQHFIHFIYRRGTEIQEKNPDEILDNIFVRITHFPHIFSEVSGYSQRRDVYIYTNPSSLIEFLNALENKTTMDLNLPQAQNKVLNNKNKL